MPNDQEPEDTPNESRCPKCGSMHWGTGGNLNVRVCHNIQCAHARPYPTPREPDRLTADEYDALVERLESAPQPNDAMKALRARHRRVDPDTFVCAACLEANYVCGCKDGPTRAGMKGEPDAQEGDRERWARVAAEMAPYDRHTDRDLTNSLREYLVDGMEAEAAHRQDHRRLRDQQGPDTRGADRAEEMRQELEFALFGPDPGLPRQWRHLVEVANMYKRFSIATNPQGTAEALDLQAKHAALVEAARVGLRALLAANEDSMDWPDDVCDAIAPLHSALAAIKPAGPTFGSGHKYHCPANLNAIAKCECENIP